MLTHYSLVNIYNSFSFERCVKINHERFLESGKHKYSHISRNIKVNYLDRYSQLFHKLIMEN